MNEMLTPDERTTGNVADGAKQPSADTVALIRRYMQIQQEIAALEQERERLREALVNGLDGKVPPRWHSEIDGSPILVVHRRQTTIRYNERLLRDRLGDKYAEILEIDGKKIRKNRELIRPLLAPVIDQVGTPAAARVEAAIRSGALPIEAFKGAFKKTYSPYISIQADHVRSAAPAVDVSPIEPI